MNMWIDAAFGERKTNVRFGFMRDSQLYILHMALHYRLPSLDQHDKNQVVVI